MQRLTVSLLIVLALITGAVVAQLPVVESHLSSLFTNPSPSDTSTKNDIRGLGYLGGTQSLPDETGVSRHERDKTHGGYNFFCGGHGTEARLLTMEGDLLHKWQYSWRQISDTLSKNKLHDPEAPTFWRQCYLNEDGSILAIFQGLGLIKLDRDSNLIWARDLGFHHDLDRHRGKIYGLTRHVTTVATEREDTFPVVNDTITVLNADGETLETYSILDAILNSNYHSLLARTLGSYQKGQAQVKYQPGDFLHPNSIQILADTEPFVRQVSSNRGPHALISTRVKDSIVLISLEEQEVVWTLSNFAQAQHDATILPNGHLMFFDNWGIHPHEQTEDGTIKLKSPRSRVVEVDPVTQSVEWMYRGNDREDFYSKCCGVSQRLDNGNTLIVESGPGRALEVTPKGEVVWAFRNPHTAAHQRDKIGTLFKMSRVSPEFTGGWLSP